MALSMVVRRTRPEKDSLNLESFSVSMGGVMFICADHGNAEQLIDYETGEPFTAHTTNPVPFILVNAGEGISLMENGRLCDIAPTLLDLLGLVQPMEMSGHSLLIRE